MKEKSFSQGSDQDFWNFAFIVLFVVLAFLFSYLIFQRNPNIIRNMNPFEFGVISLATFRLIRFFSYDKIMNFFRNYFSAYERGFRRTIHELLICLWCTGIWMALFAVVLYYLIPYGNIIVLILAIAAIGSFLQLVSKAIGKYVD